MRMSPAAIAATTAVAIGVAALVAWSLRRDRGDERASQQPQGALSANAQSSTAAGPATTSAAAANGNAQPLSAAQSGKHRSTTSTVSDEQLASQYSNMADTFMRSGLNIETLKTARKYFGGAENTRCGPTAQLYSELEEGGLPPNAVRLIVLPVADAPEISSFGETIVREVCNKMPVGLQVFKNTRENYHITLFHTSKIWDPRPDATSPSGGVDSDTPPCERPPPTEAQLEKEKAACTSIAARTPAVKLVFDRVLLADSGTLLLVWKNPCGTVWRLRDDCSEAFPGSRTIKQPDIIHTSLFRVISPANPDEYTRQGIADVCNKWTAKLRGTEWTARHLWLVYETEFSTINGERHVLDLQA